MPPPQRPPQPLVANAPATTVPSPAPQAPCPTPARVCISPTLQPTLQPRPRPSSPRERARSAQQRPPEARPSPAISSQVMRRRVGVATAWRDELSSVPEQMLGLKRAWLEARGESASAD